MAACPPSHAQTSPLKDRASADQKIVQNVLSRSEGSWDLLWNTVRSRTSITVTKTANAIQWTVWIVASPAVESGTEATDAARRCTGRLLAGKPCGRHPVAFPARPAES